MGFLIDAFLPQRCVNCGSLCSSLLCSACTSLMRFSENPDSQHYSMFIYGGMLRNLIVKAKFEPDECTARALAKYMKLHLRSQTGNFFPTDKFDCITFVPSHWLRRLTRRFEFAFILARTIADTYQIPLERLLDCTRNDPPLSSSSSSSERIDLVKGRYILRTSSKKHKKILLVDDIVTTGVTFSACAQALEKLSAEIYFFSLARTA